MEFEELDFFKAFAHEHSVRERGHCWLSDGGREFGGHGQEECMLNFCIGI
jgi:hypothetical protein